MVKTYKKPDFIVIGQEKAGTSWIYRQLESHPDFFMPHLKEIRYFHEGDDMPIASLRNLLFSKHWHFSRWRAHFKQRSKEIYSNPKQFFKNAGWYSRYFLKPHSNSWYQGLFDKNKISGDISPTYVSLSEQRIAEIKSSYPNLKVILVFRDPVDRIWSKLKMNLAKHKGIDPDSLEMDLVKEVAVKIHKVEKDYLENYNLWKKHFPEMRLLYYDDLQADPFSFMSGIVKYLGGQVDQLKEERLQMKFNVGVRKGMPVEIESFLYDLFKSQLEKMSNTLDSPYPKNWLSRDA